MMANSQNDTHRLTLRIDRDAYERLKYWAERRDVSVNEYMIDALYAQIRRENMDYDLPSAEIARLNQMYDMTMGLSDNIKSLEDVIVAGFESLIGLARGDTEYLSSYHDPDIGGE